MDESNRPSHDRRNQLIGILLVVVLGCAIVVGRARLPRRLWLKAAPSRFTAAHLLRRGRYLEAADQYRELIKRLPPPLQNESPDGVYTTMTMDLEDMMMYHDYGKALLLGGNAPEALTAYTTFQNLATEFLGVAHYSRGSALLQLGQYADAMSAFDTAIELNPNDYDGHQNRCATLRLMERYEDAVAACQDTIQRFPGIAKSHLSLGWAYELWGKPDEAITAYLEAIRLAPQWEFPRVRLAHTLQMIYGSNTDAAVERIRAHDVSLAGDIAKRLAHE